ncbi:uncharacterized protein LOC114531147 isoform X2 [Dendronephthya gigantea]|uniref:uncharacterized protein LOC114531147 isoform X2 n=1 Tax=Dendronephthya gigantea TaxID=151771 RepID=UPI00106BECC7|nr:uncharacterized protein LOC114531147 isoform X2 [Dendronephthya gigantea]
MQTNNTAIVTAISSMSDLLAASLSSLKTTMTNSFAEMQNTLGQMGVDDGGELLDIEKFDTGEPSSKRARVDAVELPQQSGTTEPTENDIDVLINQNSQVSGKETQINTNNDDLHVLSGIANDLKLEQQKSPAVNEQLAKIVQSLMREKLDDDVLAQTQKRHLIPENCDSLATTKVNHLIWDKLKPDTRSGNIKLQRVQAHIVKGVIPVVNVIQAVINAREKIPQETLNVEDLLRAGTDAIALLGAANFELNMRRRDNIKHDDYKHLCSPTVPFTEFLFGNDGELSKQLKDLTEATKVSKKIARRGYKPEFNRQRNYKPGQKRAYGLGYRNGPHSSNQANKHLNWKRPGLPYSRERVEGKSQNNLIILQMSLIGRCLEKIQQNNAEGIMIVPFWPSQSWYPKLLRLLVDYPAVIPPMNNLLKMPVTLKLHPLRKKLSLLACCLCGESTKTEGFFQRQQTSSSAPGENPRINNTEHTLQLYIWQPCGRETVYEGYISM